MFTEVGTGESIRVYPPLHVPDLLEGVTTTVSPTATPPRAGSGLLLRCAAVAYEHTLRLCYFIE